MREIEAPFADKIKLPKAPKVKDLKKLLRYQIKQASEADAYFHELEHGGEKLEDQKKGESMIDQISGFVAWLCG